MSRKRMLFITISLSLIFYLPACTKTEEPDTRDAPPAAARILISEIQTGVEGNNNDEFIELYNAGDLPGDLSGWAIMYGLNATDEDLLVYQWNYSMLIPPHGHVLLVRSGVEAEATADAVFDQSLNNSFGGLALVDSAGNRIDSIGWGKAPETFVEGSPAVSLTNGTALERAPGGAAGSTQDTDDNSADFTLRENADPQTTGSAFTPAGNEIVVMVLDGPSSVEPGATFTYQIAISNPSAADMAGITVLLPIDKTLSVSSLSQNGSFEESLAVWMLESLPAGETSTVEIEVSAPWQYGTALAVNARAQQSTGQILGFAGSLRTRIEGGTLPINIARATLGAEVTIEGTATMYTGGFYAGSGAKFYLEDATGGVQIYVSGAGGTLDIPLGARVRVHGNVIEYNNSIEITPVSAADVEIISIHADDFAPLQVTIHELLAAPYNYTGRLVQVTGRTTRIEEFNYSYEFDLTSDAGDILSLYVDKLTEIDVEALDLDHSYRTTGILEWRSTALYLNPRIHDDIEEIYAPELLIEAGSPSSIQADGEATVTLTVFNHRPDLVSDLEISIRYPAEGGTVSAILDDGEQQDDGIHWTIKSLPGDGESISVRYTVQPTDSSEMVAREYAVTYADGSVSVFGPDRRIFIGAGVPIWAIQGKSDTSPYKLESLITQGVVTGIFPELGGFFIQDPAGDDDPETSDGLFIAIEEPDLNLSIGDLVTVTGLVRESSRQTQLTLNSTTDITIDGHTSSLPAAIAYAPPIADAEALLYNEPLEGMLVIVTGPARAVAPTSNYGEYALVLDDYPEERVWRGDPTGMLITVDDGSAVAHINRSTLACVVAVGDYVSNIRGLLAYSYGRYKIEPVSNPTLHAVEITLPVMEEPAEDEFSLMTWNVENLFDILNPHPSSPPIPTAGEYKLDLSKVANTILSAGAPTVIALQEVENIGIMEDLAGHELLSAYNYVPFLIEGKDSRGIDVAYLVRGDLVTVSMVEQRDAPGEVFSRPPLLLQATITTSTGETEIFILNNHFLSLSAGEELTEPRRTAQAAWNGSIVEEILTSNPDAVVAVVGDLNSFYATAPLAALTEAGLTHVYDLPGMEVGYSYIYQGASQTLDHILISAGLAEIFSKYRILHVNADYPPAIPEDSSPLRKSDHDPVIAWFQLP